MNGAKTLTVIYIILRVINNKQSICIYFVFDDRRIMIFVFEPCVLTTILSQPIQYFKKNLVNSIPKLCIV